MTNFASVMVTNHSILLVNLRGTFCRMSPSFYIFRSVFAQKRPIAGYI